MLLFVEGFEFEIYFLLIGGGRLVSVFVECLLVLDWFIIRREKIEKRIIVLLSEFVVFNVVFVY